MSWGKRRYWREQARIISAQEVSTVDLTELLADDLDIAQEFERSELIALLDRTLALLPSQSRDALILQYIEEKPGAEVAKQLGVSERALAVRVHRAKAALKQVFSTTLAQEVAAFGMGPLDTPGWLHISCGNVVATLAVARIIHRPCSSLLAFSVSGV